MTDTQPDDIMVNNPELECPRCKKEVPLGSFVPNEKLCIQCLREVYGNADMLKRKIVSRLLGILAFIGVTFFLLVILFILIFEL